MTRTMGVFGFATCLSLATLCSIRVWGDPLFYNLTLLPEKAAVNLRCDSKAESALRFDISDLLQKFGSTDFDLGHSVPTGRSLHGTGRSLHGTGRSSRSSEKHSKSDASTTDCKLPHTCTSQSTLAKTKEDATSFDDTIQNVRDGLDDAGDLAKKIICVGLKLKLAEVTEPQNLADIACSCVVDDNIESNCALIELIATQLVCQSTRCPVRPFAPILESLDIDDDLQEQLGRSLYRSDDRIALMDFGVTPEIIDRDVVKKERLSYLTAIRSIFVIYASAVSEMCFDEEMEPSIKDWELLAVFNAITSTGDESTKRFPLAHLRARPNKRNEQKLDFLVAIRGTLTPEERGINFSYNQTTMSFPGFSQMRVHRGFAYAAQELWDPLSLILSSHANDGTLGRVTIAGHSLGAGIASVVAIHATAALQQKPNVILYGWPRTGDDAFMMELAKRTRLRSVQGVFDPVPYIPCKTMPACPISGHRIAEASDADDNGASVATFASARGLIEIGPDDLTSDWSDHSNQYRNVPAWHACSYLCWTSLITNQTAQACYAKTSDKSTQSVCPFFITK